MLSSFWNKHPVLGLVIAPDRAKFGAASLVTGAEIQNSASETFCRRTLRIYVPSFVDVGPAVSELYGFENVDTRMDARMDIRPVL